MATAYYKSLLSQNEKNIYDHIFRGLREFQNKMFFPRAQPQAVERAFEAIKNDMQELFFVSGSFHMLSSISGVELQLSCLYNKNESVRILNQLKRIAEQVVAPFKNRSHYETAIALHDYLVSHVRYSERLNAAGEAHSPVGALINRECVCEGYARAYKFLCDKAKIPCIVVSGTAVGMNGTPEGHAWNMIGLDTGYYHVDVTFDQYIDRQYCSKQRMFLSTEEISVDHQPGTAFRIPHCSGSRSPLVQVKSMNELIASLQKDRRNGVRYSEYRLSSLVDTNMLINSLTGRLTSSDIMLYNSKAGFFYDNAPKISCLGVRWRAATP